LLDRAQHLSTKYTPTIYYKPYILTTDQKALVEEQISQAQAQIDANEEGTTLRPLQESDLRRDDGATVEDEKAGEGEDTNAGGVQEEGQRSPSPPAGNALKDDEALVSED